MIHTIYITPDTDPLWLKKEFRKKLMTGGAVIRLCEDLNECDLQNIFNRYLPLSYDNNLYSLVLEEIAKCEKTPLPLRKCLRDLNIKNLKRLISDLQM